MTLLETLPGWPVAPDVSWLHMVLLMVVGPIVTAAVVTVLVLGPKGLRKHAPSTEVARRSADS